MLSSARILSILQILIKEQIFTPDKLDPHKWAEEINSYATLYLDDITNSTNISKDELTKFVYQTVPCIANVTQEYKNNTALMVDNILQDCFFVVVVKSTCAFENLNAAVRGLMLLLSFILISILTCRFKRKRFKVHLLGGRPGPVIPLNMLDNYENRKGFAIAFGLTVATSVNVLFGDYKTIVGTKAAASIKDFPGYLSSFIKIGFAVFVAMLSYPFFVCQSMTNKLVGAIIGLIFCLVFIALELVKIVLVVSGCWSFFEKVNIGGTGPMIILSDLPKYICLILLTIKFMYVIYKTIKLRRKKGRQANDMIRFSVVHILSGNDSDWRKGYIYKHVKSIFWDVQNSKEDEEEQTLLQKLKSKLYTVKPGFQYSTRVVATFVVSSIAVYLLFVYMIYIGYLIFDAYWDLIFDSVTVKEISKVTGLPINHVEDYGYCIVVSWWLGIIFALIFYFLVAMNSLAWYRRHIMMLRKGDRSFLPNSIKKGSLDAGTLMASSLKYAGFQIGYSAWGFIIMSLIGFILFAVLSTQIFLPMKTKRLSTVLIYAIKYWPTILIGIVVTFAQKLAAKHCFLIDKEAIGVDNRRAFHITSYFMFYFNIFLGLVSCLIRIIYGILCGVLFLQRLQKSSLPRSYERRDPGYLTYMGYLLLEHYHANPVLQCFVRLLLENEGKILEDEYRSQESGNNDTLADIDTVVTKEKKKSYRQKRAEIRWFLFIILAQNPSLLKYRKRNLPKTKSHLSKALFNFTNIEEELHDSATKKNGDSCQNGIMEVDDGKENLKTELIASETEGDDDSVDSNEVVQVIGRNSIDNETRF